MLQAGKVAGIWHARMEDLAATLAARGIQPIALHPAALAEYAEKRPVKVLRAVGLQSRWRGTFESPSNAANQPSGATIVRLNILLSLLAAMLLTCAGASAQSYAEGQVWEYKTRPGESGSLLKIVMIENDPRFGEIYHISVVGLKMANPRAPKEITTELPHVPVSHKTLESSLTKPSSSKTAFPDYREGYATWRVAFESDKAAIFTQDMAQIVTIVEETLKRGKRPKGPLKQ